MPNITEADRNLIVTPQSALMQILSELKIISMLLSELPSQLQRSDLALPGENLTELRKDINLLSE